MSALHNSANYGIGFVYHNVYMHLPFSAKHDLFATRKVPLYLSAYNVVYNPAESSFQLELKVGGPMHAKRQLEGSRKKQLLN